MDGVLKLKSEAVSVEVLDKGLDSKIDGFVIYDVATGYLDCYPIHTKNTEETIQALQHFLGPKGKFG